LLKSPSVEFRVRAGLIQSLLKKTLKIRFPADSVSKEEKEGAAKKDKGQKDEAEPEEDQRKSRAGRIINLMSSDLDTIFTAWSTSPWPNSGEAVANVFCSNNIFMDLGSLPIVILFSLIFLYGLLGWSSIVGVTMMVITTIIPGMLVKLLAKIKRKTRLASDARIETMTETLYSIINLLYCTITLVTSFLNLSIDDPQTSLFESPKIAAIFPNFLIPISHFPGYFGCRTRC